MRRLSALVAVLALAACFGRVSAWAAPAGDPHACCSGEAPAKAPAVAECCATTAAVAAPQAPVPDLAVVDIPVLDVPAPRFAPPAAEASAPPGPQTRLSSVPARAPPPAA